MNQFDKFEECKKEIRSVLIPYQRGCLLSEFNRTYMELIGRRLPIREFGFSSDIEFLYSMPDVVTITPTRTREYHLTAVADEKSFHIQKMVARQKPAKLPRSTRTSNSNYALRNSCLPPRFTKAVLNSNVSTSKEVRQSFSSAFPYKETPKLPPKAEPTLPPKAVLAEPKNVTTKPVIDEPKLPPLASPKDEVIALVEHFNNQIPIEDLLFLYQKMYQKNLNLKNYGISSIEECIEDIPELYLKNINKQMYVLYQSNSPNNSYVNEICSDQDTRKRENHQNYAEDTGRRISEAPSSSSQSEYNNNRNDNRTLIPDSLRGKLQMVGERFPEGIRSSEFPSCFEEVTGGALDLYSLGYRCLNDLIDDVPNILTREPVPGSKKDFIIYSSGKSRSELNKSTVSSDYSTIHVILNLRKILAAYSEGIQLQDLSNIYSINFSDTLCIKDFGFDDLETFLTSIKNQVPLRIKLSKGIKTVYLTDHNDRPESIEAPQTPQEVVIPFNAAYPDFKFEPQTLANDFDYSKYIPVYTSSVAHPGHLHIQLQGEETADALVKLAKSIETFYSGGRSILYAMKNIHIKVGASCVAQWPADDHWYRAEIISIPCMETVQVHYVDYGTRDTIPKKLLRYIKKEYVCLPAQALRCRLAFLKPPKNETKWSVQSRSRILQLCEDVPLMAKIEEIEMDGVYSIVLCDTNGDEDVYFNDILCNEELADYDVGEDSKDPPVASKPVAPVEYHHNLSPLQALQAQYFLQAFVTVAPSFAQNVNYKNLLREVTMYCSKPNQELQNVNIPPVTTLAPPGFNSLLSNIPGHGNSDIFSGAFNMPSITTSPEGKPRLSIINPPVASSSSSDTFKSVELPFDENPEADCEIFVDEDDDEMFHEFCQKISLARPRHVRRVLLGDGYKIHIIVVDSIPYTSSGDVSQLIFSNKEDDYLLRRLQPKDVDIPSISMSEVGNEELFQQLEKFCVKGIKKTSGFKASILLYPLRVVIKILNIFGHPSVTLRTKLTEEIANFNPSDPDWRNFSSPEPQESEEDQNLSGITDDDKIEKLCLFDLLVMKEAVIIRRKKLMNSLNNIGSDGKIDEMEKLEQMHQKVVLRIQEIKEICSVFS